ncbi:MAG: hypothetical protein J5848_06600 [Bacteroidales bacterium]|nr:hypothetical protein [Bacteroidales bacterium]
MTKPINHIKALAFILFLMGFAWQTQATEQYPDYIEYGGKKYELAVSWGHPSPLQVLYIRTNTQSPFKGWSTANYRGHIATWRISDGKLYLVNVDTRRHRGRTGTYWSGEEERVDTVAAPGYFNIASLSVQPTADDGAVVADWFSGVLTIENEVADDGNRVESDGVRYVYIRYGEVVDDQLVTAKDFERMQNITDKDTSDHAFMDKYRIAYLNQNYISYYFQSGMSHDEVTYQGHTGRFEGRDFHPLLMSLFDYDPLQFYFNWENFQRNGTPVCTWSISHDSLFINSITLYSGLGFYEHDEDTVGLAWIFKPERIVDGKVFAFWMNGEQTIEYGEEREGDFGMKEFQLERQQRIMLDSGRIIQSTWTPAAFDAGSETATFADCNPEHVYRCDHWGASDRYKELPVAAVFPAWAEGDDALQRWFDSHPLTDPRAKEMMFRTILLFKVNCRGEASEWVIASKGKGVLFELSNQVLEIAKQLPNGWTPATDENGNAVDCWQVMSFNVSQGELKKCYVQEQK